MLYAQEVLSNLLGISWFLDKMVALLEVHAYELPYEEIVNTIGEILSAWEKAEWWKEQHIFT